MNSDIPLTLDPNHKNNNFHGKYIGGLVPIFLLDLNSARVHRCKCPETFDEEIGEPPNVAKGKK